MSEEFNNLLESEKDEGIYDGGIRLKTTTGDWLVMFIGSDDFLKPNAIKLYKRVYL
jgi:hypothetical protein